MDFETDLSDLAVFASRERMPGTTKILKDDSFKDIREFAALVRSK
jgi:hypothetical protein